MANEITVSVALAYADSEDADESLAVSDLKKTITTKKYTKYKQSVGITEEALVLGEVTAPGYVVFINRDETNFVELRVGTAGAKFAKLFPGDVALLRLGSGAQVPFAIADTSPCILEVFLLST